MLSSKRWEIGSHAIQETGGHIAISNVGGVGTFLSNKKWLSNLKRLETSEEYNKRIAREIVNSKKILEETFHTPIISFSYPFSDYGQQSLNNEAYALSLIRELIQENYQVAFKQVWPEDSQFTYNYPDTDPRFLKRIEVPPTWSGTELISFLQKSNDKTLPFTTSFAGNDGWKKTWGQVITEKNTMTLNSTSQGTGGSLFLDGSYLWKNYIFTANLDLQKGETYTLMAHYRDGENYAACSFSSISNYIRAEQYINNVRTLLAEGRGKPVVLGEEHLAGISVSGSTINCYQDGEVVAMSPILSSLLPNGGIGFKVWDPKIGEVSLLVLETTVRSN